MTTARNRHCDIIYNACDGSIGDDGVFGDGGEGVYSNGFDIVFSDELCVDCDSFVFVIVIQ